MKNQTITAHPLVNGSKEWQQNTEQELAIEYLQCLSESDGGFAFRIWPVCLAAPFRNAIFDLSQMIVAEIQLSEALVDLNIHGRRKLSKCAQLLGGNSITNTFFDNVTLH